MRASVPSSPTEIRWLGGRPALGLFLLLSLALNYPYLAGGFQADDLLFINMFRQHPLPFSRWLGAWSVAVDQFSGFVNLWWFEPGVSGSFFRPLPSLIFEGSLRLFEQNAVPLHLLSLLLHGLVAFSIFRLFTRLTGKAGTALLAGLLFVTCEDHSMGVGWIATMTDLLSVAFINLALIAHLRWREARRPVSPFHLVSRISDSLRKSRSAARPVRLSVSIARVSSVRTWTGYTGGPRQLWQGRVR